MNNGFNHTPEAIKDRGEVFTPTELVNEMLDKLEVYNPTYFKDPKKTCIDPAAGTGNMLIEVLKRKLQNHHNPVQALNTLYGAEIMRDNVAECRLRLLDTVESFKHKITYEMCQAVIKNIVWTPLHKYPNGSLDYLDPDSTTLFSKIPPKEQVDHLLKMVNGEIPASEEDVKEAEDDKDMMWELCFGNPLTNKNS